MEDLVLDRTRHITIFDSDKFQGRIDVIGAGATGSRIVNSLAKLGLENIHVWDFDVIEPHNIANQTFGLKDVGLLKVDALCKQVELMTGIKVTGHNERVDGSQELGEIIYLLTDTMSSRKEIWEAGIKYNFSKKLMIETRMGTNVGRVYTINPTNPSHISRWEGTLCSDDVAEVSACGSAISVGPTADILAGYAVWQMIRSLNDGDPVEEELIFSTECPLVMTEQFIAA